MIYTASPDDLNRDIHLDVIAGILSAEIERLEAQHSEAAQHAANVRADLQPVASQWAVEDEAHRIYEALEEARAALEWVQAQRPGKRRACPYGCQGWMVRLEGPDADEPAWFCPMCDTFEPDDQERARPGLDYPADEAGHDN